MTSVVRLSTEFAKLNGTARMCVCVREREREREKKRVNERERERERNCVFSDGEFYPPSKPT